MENYLYDLMEILLLLFHLLIISKYMKAYFGKSKSNSLTCVVWCFYYAFLIISKVSTYISPGLLLLGNFLFIFLICTLYQYSNAKVRCIFSLLICTIWMLVEVVVIITLTLLGLKGENLQTTGGFLSKLCMLILIVIFENYIHGKIHRDISIKYFLTILLIPISSIFLIHNIFLIAFQNRIYISFAIISSLLLLIISYVIFEIFNWMEYDSEIKEQNRIFEQQLKICDQQTAEKENLYMEIKQIRHDIKNHLTAILGLIQKNGKQEAENYIYNLLNDGIIEPSEKAAHSGNIVIDSLVNYKCALAHKEGIDFQADIFIPSLLPFQAAQLAIIFGNLLENALEACRKITEGKRYIHIQASYVKEVLFIMICNPYIGKRIKNKNGKYLTSKKDTSHHGYGLLSVEQSVSCYDGQISITEKDNIFKVSIVMYGTKSKSDGRK